MLNATNHDRLFSGKPVIIESTAPSRYCFEDGGLFRFTTPSQIITAFETIEADYDNNCRRAREIAEQHFDAEVVAGAVLERALP